MGAASGNRSLVSDFGNAAEGPLGANPSGVALEASGTVLVIDPDAGTGGNGALFRVDAISGNRSLVSNFGTRGVAVEASGTVLVIDGRSLFRVDAVSGISSLVSDFGNPAQGPLGVTPIGLALEADGAILVIDRDAKIDPDTPTFGRGALFRVDAASGNRSLVSDFGDPVQGPLGDAPHGVAVEAGGTVLVIDRDAALTTAGQSQSRSGVLFRVDRLNGLRTVVNDFTNPPRGSDPVGVAVGVANSGDANTVGPPPGPRPPYVCDGSACRVPLKCNAVGIACSARVTLFAFVPRARLSDRPAAQAVHRVRFAAGVANIPPGEVRTVRLRLKRGGRQIVESGTRRRLRGLMEIRNSVGGIQTISIRIRIKARP